MIKESENKKLNKKDKVLKLLNSCLVEAESPVTFYDVHSICRTLKISAPKLDLIFEELRNNGFYAVKTHFSPTAIKTDALINNLKEIIMKLQ